MPTRYGASPWVDAVPRSRRGARPRLRGEHTAQVAIIGGGLTGCATAYACAVAGLNPVLVETDRLGQSGAGRGAGLLLPEPGPAFREVVAKHGLRTSRQIFQDWRRASLDAAALLRRLRIPCELEGADSAAFARGAEEKALQREFEARKKAGLEARWLTPALSRKAIKLDAAAMRLSGAFTFDAYRACLGLARAAQAKGALLFEQSPVTKVRFLSKHAEVTLRGAMIRCQTVIVATGSPTAEFKPLRRHFKRRERSLVLTEPLTAAMRKEVGPRGVLLQDPTPPGHSVRWTRDGRALVSGAEHDETPPARLAAARVQRTGQLMYELLLMYPVISGLQAAFGWETVHGRTADGIPYFGAHRNYPRHLFAFGGGDSATGAFLAGRLLARAAAGAPDKGDEVFGWTR